MEANPHLTKARLLEELGKLPDDMTVTIRNFKMDRDIEETTMPGDIFRSYKPSGKFHAMIEIEIAGEIDKTTP